MLDRLKQLQVEALSEVANTTDLKELNDLRVKYLGKKGPIQEVMKNMKDMAPEERKSAGHVSNEVKSVISQAIETKKAELEALAIQQQLANEKIDVTLPAAPTIWCVTRWRCCPRASILTPTSPF